jgi:hypothetical protein
VTPSGPSLDRLKPKYTVKTRAPGAAIGPGGGGTGGGGTKGAQAATAKSEQNRTIARFIWFLPQLRSRR